MRIEARGRWSKGMGCHTGNGGELGGTEGGEDAVNKDVTLAVAMHPFNSIGSFLSSNFRRLTLSPHRVTVRRSSTSCSSDGLSLTSHLSLTTLLHGQSISLRGKQLKLRDGLPRLLHRSQPLRQHSPAHSVVCSPIDYDHEGEESHIDSREKDVGRTNTEGKQISSEISSNNRIIRLFDALYKLSRPYVIARIVVSIISMSFIAASSLAEVFSATFLVELLKAIIPAVLMNMYANAVNQVFDVEIDKINKPYLPLASGAISMEFGVGVAIAFLLGSLFMGVMSHSPALLSALIIWAVVATLYSADLPLMRWKNNTFAASILFVIQGSIVYQLCYFIHMQKYVLGRSIMIPKSIVFATAFMFPFAIVIAMFKDIPDVEGDRKHGLKTLAVTLGRERVFWLSINMLSMAYGIGMAIGATSSSHLNIIVTVFGHFLLGSLLIYRALTTNVLDQRSTQSLYLFIRKLCCVEYLLIPFMR